MSSTRVLLADDHHVFRNGIRQILELKGGFDVIGEAANGEEAIRLAATLKPDVILMDIKMPGINGIQATREILKSCPQARILMLTMYRENQMLDDALEAGARGFLLKNADADELVEAVRRIHREELIFDSKSQAGQINDSRRQGIYVLGDSRMFLDSLLEIANEAIICVNEKREIILFSGGAEAVFGYSQEEAIGQSLEILIPESFHGVHANHVSNFIASEEKTLQMNQRQPIQARRKNGENFPAHASVGKHKTPDGQVFAVILRDVSEQERLEERLSKFLLAIEQTPASVVITDTKGIIEYVNPAFERVTGYSSREAVGATPRVIKSGLMQDETYQSMWKTILDGQVWYGELCNRKKNGELFWELGTVSPLRNRDGAITNFISIKEDITERKRTEEELHRYRRHLEEMVEERTKELRDEANQHKRTAMALREKEQELNLALHIGQLGRWDMDLRTEEMSWSDEVYRIFGLNPDSVKLRYSVAIEMTHPEDRAMAEQALESAIADGRPINMDHRIISQDGQQRSINLTAVPVLDNAGRIIKVVGTIQDITERERIKAELLEKERMSNELAVGRNIQLSMLPKTSPSVKGWQFAGFYQAAREVSGDFYDFIELPNGKIGMLVADVCGKGVPAALLMALSRAIIRTVAVSVEDPSKTLTRSNEILNQDYPSDDFITALYAVLDTTTGRVDFASAGHCYPLWYSAKDGGAKRVKVQGAALGIFPIFNLTPADIEMSTGDALLLYTDGLIEARNAQGEFFEEKYLAEIFQANACRPASEILNAITRAWQDFIGEQPQADDLTLIVAKRVASEES